MEIEEYLVDKESVAQQISAFDDVDTLSSSKEGTLACTPYRLVYVRGNNVKDISVNEVNSIEYTEPSFPKKYLWSGIGAVGVGIVIALVGMLISDAASTPELSLFGWVIGGIMAASGIGSLIQGYFLQRATLRIHTPSRTYEFASKEDDLDEIGHTVRGYEMKNSLSAAD